MDKNETRTPKPWTARHLGQLHPCWLTAQSHSCGGVSGETIVQRLLIAANMSFIGGASLSSARIVVLGRQGTASSGLLGDLVAVRKSTSKSTIRWLSSSRSRGNKPRSNYRRRLPHYARAKKSEKDQYITNKSSNQQSAKSATTLGTTKASSNANDNGISRFFKTPVAMLSSFQFRYRKSGAKYTSEHAAALAQRLPMGLVLVGLFLWDQTNPFSWIILKGPSMLPTMAADGSEVWITYSPWFLKMRRLGGYFHESKSIYRKGDIVGFSPPNNALAVSCKRIIGVAGDEVASNGENVDLFVEQDPSNLGKSPLNPSHALYPEFAARRQLGLSAMHTEIVPENHVWVEADNPGMGIDSRQFGPIPKEWIRGVVVGRAWPIWSFKRPLRIRPHPIPLDGETLAKYNVHPLLHAPAQVDQQEPERVVSVEQNL